MAHDSSFTVDENGIVVGWHHESNHISPASAREIVGQPVGLLLGRLLDQFGESHVGNPVALQLHAEREGSNTVISIRDAVCGSPISRVEAVFETAAFEQSAAGLEAYDTNLHVLRSNSSALAMRGLPADRVLAHPVADLGSRLPLTQLLGRVLSGSEPAVHETVHGHDGHGGRQIFSVTAFKLQEELRTIGVGAVIHDVTGQERAQSAVHLLARAEAEIGTTLDAMRTSRDLASVATHDFADATSVDLVDAVLQGDEAPAPPLSTDVPLRRAAFESTGDTHALYPVGETSQFVSPSPYMQVLIDLTPRLLDPKISASDWLMHDAARAGALRDAGIHSMIIVPLSFHGRVLGLVSFYRGRQNSVAFDTSDVALAKQLSAKASAHLENARCYTRERNTAVTLQRSLLPRSFPDLSAVNTAHFYTPGARQTVWFDVIELSGARVGLVIGQVSRQGLNESATMGRFRTAVGTLAALDLPPDELLVHLDDAARYILPDPAGPQALSGSLRCQYAIYDSVTGELAIAAAGWPPPLLTSPAGSVTEVDLPVGPPLGQGASYESHRQPIAPQSTLTFYSPSLLGPGPRSEERITELRQAVAHTDDGPKATCDSIVERLMGQRVDDGTAILVAQTHRLPDSCIATWTVSREPSAVSACRRRTSRQLRDWGLDSLVFTTELVVSELVTNVIRHTSGIPTVRLIRDRTLTVEVSDEAATSPHLRHARAQDEDGRGLLIVASLAQRWGTRYRSNGKIIWVEESLDKGT
ncbi:SpoIIE family protein phosphatase [Streptomyces sp. NPDC017964]|uniref:ATP-binding SpoIIE family protein phosphatase n=1 Tax=Streptomyces sp. NPDC017964 TaxID=3365022 RepID=UPI0037B7885F